MDLCMVSTNWVLVSVTSSIWAAICGEQGVASWIGAMTDSGGLTLAN